MKKLLLVVSFLIIIPISFCSDITFINSDTTSYRNETIQCDGNVIIAYHGKIISASHIEYGQDTDTIQAKGNVVIKDELGNTYLADYIQVQNNFKTGYATNLKIITPNKMRLAAEKCKIINNEYELENTIFTPCYECIESGALTWQLKSQYVTFNPKDYTTYTNATLESFNIPIMYLPHLTTVSNNVKRKSGLLVPKFSSSSQQGFSATIPYLWSISDSQELILKPIFTTKIGHVAWIYYGLRIPHGELTLDTSITGTKSVNRKNGNNEKECKATKKIQNSNYRGHIFSKFNYELNNNWRAIFDINLASDRYYLKRFPIVDNVNRTLESSAKIEGFHHRNYTRVKTSIFQSDYLDTVPKILPHIEHNHFTNLFGGTFQVDTSCINLEFKNNRRSQKYIVNTSWDKEFMLPFGQLLNFDTVTSFQGLCVSESKRSDYSSYSQVLPQLNLTWQWPLAAQSFMSDAIISPILGVSLAPNKNHFDIMENPFDEINETNLFSNNKSISPYNIDSGCRYFYGAKINGYSHAQNIYRFMIGQSVDITKRKNILESSGIKNKHSNIISTLDIFLTKNLSFLTVCSFSTKNKTWEKVESGLNYNNGNLSFDLLAFKGKQCFYDPFKTFQEPIEEISQKKYKGVYLNSEYKITRKTTLDYSIVFGNDYSPIDTQVTKSEKLKLIKHGIGITYENECSKISFKCERNNRYDGDLRPETSFKVVVQLKKLG